MSYTAPTWSVGQAVTKTKLDQMSTQYSQVFADAPSTITNLGASANLFIGNLTTAALVAAQTKLHVFSTEDGLPATSGEVPTAIQRWHVDASVNVVDLGITSAGLAWIQVNNRTALGTLGKLSFHPRAASTTNSPARVTVGSDTDIAFFGVVRGAVTTDATATVAASATWNSSGTTHRGVDWVFTETATAATSTYLRILGGVAGTTEVFAVKTGGSLAWGGGSAISSSSNVPLLNAANVFTALGTHSWSAANSASQIIKLENTTSGTGAAAYFQLTAGTTNGYFLAYSQGYTTSGLDIAASVHFFAQGAGGFTLSAQHASGIIRFATGAGPTLRGYISEAGGFVWGAPTGGDRGSGTINAVAVYDDNVLLTDWVFDLYYEGTTVHQVPAHGRLFSLADTRTATRDDRRLPWMPARQSFEEERNLGSMVTRLWFGQEQQQIYIQELETRLAKIERRAGPSLWARLVGGLA